jgi:ADP-ribosyl-[dinitrogen reductase] hydrolase
LGAPVEFWTAAQIKQKYGRLTEMVGGGWLNVRPGEFTDDTQMMLCVAGGLIENPPDPVEAVGRRFMDWYDNKPKDIGSATRAALVAHDAGVAWDKCGGEQAEGNGCLMRTLPISFVYQESMPVWETSKKVAAMTHKATAALEACAFYNWLVAFNLLTGHRKYQNYGHQEIGLSLYPGVEPMEPTGRCLNTLHNALWAFLTTDTFEDAVVAVVNLGGDADTAGAVCGGLAGTYYGYGGIPKRWLDVLEKKDELEEAATGLLVTRNCVEQM